jgi:hypothetical protein
MSRKLVGYRIGDNITIDLCPSCAREVCGSGMLKKFPDRFKVYEGYQDDPETIKYCKDLKEHEGREWNGEFPCLRCDDIIGRPGVKDIGNEKFLEWHPSGIYEITEEHLRKAMTTKATPLNLPEGWPFHKK